MNAWLAKNGITAASTSASGDMVTIQVPAEKANALLNANFTSYLHEASNTTMVRTLAYSLPDDIHDHVAFVYPDREELGKAVQRLLDHGVEIANGADHGGSVSVYLSDPDGNGVELYYDRPRSAWIGEDGLPVLKSDHFDHRELLPNP